MAEAPVPEAITEGDLSRIIEMAWEDRTPFETIQLQFGLNEAAVISLMRRTMKPSSFRMWRKRMAGRISKHRSKSIARTRFDADPIADASRDT